MEALVGSALKLQTVVAAIAGVLAVAAPTIPAAQTGAARGATADRGAVARTPWNDPDLQGEWTSEGEYGVPIERPAQFGTRQFLTADEYAKRLEDVRLRDERDAKRIDVFAGNVE